MSEHRKKKGFYDGYYGHEVRFPHDQDYLFAYGRGYEQAEKDSHFTEQQMRYMENEDWKHED